MDIVFINQTFGMGGAENFSLSLVKYLTSQNHILHTYSNHTPLINLFKKENLTVTKVPFAVDILGDWKGFLKAFIFIIPLSIYYLYIVLSLPKAKVYYFTGYIEKIICTPILKILGKRVVWIEFGPMQIVFNKFARLPEFLYRCVSGLPDVCIFSSHNSRELNRQYFPSHVSLKVIQLGSPNPPKHISEISKFDTLCLSRLQKDKGQDLLIIAWSDVVKQFPHAQLIIAGVGDKSYTNLLNSLIIKLKLEKNIKLVGFIRDKYAYLKACKFTVFPSVWPLEGFGLVITESFSLGKPVIAFNHPPGNELIKSSQNGLLVDQLSDGIITLFQNPDLLKKLSHQALIDYQAFYRENIYLKKYADTILS